MELGGLEVRKRGNSTEKDILGLLSRVDWDGENNVKQMLEEVNGQWLKVQEKCVAQ